ncbi:hypothetical protein A7U60_g9014 [Sanghuangporus baumii]|uniref:Uncharacterized protein n=1 Tax=Sanghuangporus baumii TaxID=108892 RepID=A0A9Q5N8A3_SANBA|nr:hypothetical protein A7U60_g9014 [Sanghuangporus baumii]
MTKTKKTNRHQSNAKSTSSSKTDAASPATKEVKPVQNAPKAATKEVKPVQNAPKAGSSTQQDGIINTGGLEKEQEESNETSKAETVPQKRGHDQEYEASSAPSKKRRRKGKMAKKEKSSSDPQSSPQMIRKLAPPRPFPTVPTSVSATGPRSAHKEGKNRICITRKTDLGAYLRRCKDVVLQDGCKDVVLQDGYKTLYLHAMGAAIPHLARLAVSLPSILPYDSSEIQTEVRTGTVEVQDEIIPDDEDEDVSLRTRGKSTMSVTIKIEGGDNESAQTSTKKQKDKGKGKTVVAQNGDIGKTSADTTQLKQLVFTESDLEDDVL